MISGTWHRRPTKASLCSAPFTTAHYAFRPASFPTMPYDQPTCRPISGIYLSLPFSRLIWAKRRSRSPRFDTSPCTPVTFLPVSFTASANSGSRRPVMKTYVDKLLDRRKANAAIATSNGCNFLQVYPCTSSPLLFLYGTLTRFNSRISSAAPSPQAPFSSNALTMIFGSQPPARPMPFMGSNTNHATRLGPSAPITSAFDQ